MCVAYWIISEDCGDLRVDIGVNTADWRETSKHTVMPTQDIHHYPDTRTVSTATQPASSQHAPGFLPFYRENFLLCVLMNLALPLVPLAFEWAFTDELKFASLLLAASFFLISLRVSSFSRFYFGLSFAAGIALAAWYGRVEAVAKSVSALDFLSAASPLDLLGRGRDVACTSC